MKQYSDTLEMKAWKENQPRTKSARREVLGEVYGRSYGRFYGRSFKLFCFTTPYYLGYYGKRREVLVKKGKKQNLKIKKTKTLCNFT